MQNDLGQNDRSIAPVREPPVITSGLSQPPVITRSPSPASAPVNSPLRISQVRLAFAFAIASLSDLLSILFAFAPPLEWGLDFFTALMLFMVLGWRWLLLPGLILEAIPAFAVFPFWVLVVGAIAVWGTVRPNPTRA